MAAVNHPLANGFSEALLLRWLDEIATTTIAILLSPAPKGKVDEYSRPLELLDDYERSASELAQTSLAPPRLPDEWLRTTQMALLDVANRGGGRWKDRHSEYFFTRTAGLLAAAFRVKPTPTAGAAKTKAGNKGSENGTYAQFVQATQFEMLRYVDEFDANDRFPDAKCTLSNWSKPVAKTLEKRLEKALDEPFYREKIHLDFPRPPDLSPAIRCQWEAYREMYLQLSGFYDHVPK